MGVGTLLIEAHDPNKIIEYCMDDDLSEHCMLPRYGVSKHYEPYRAIAYTDCSRELKCGKCGMETCPGCSLAHFTINVDAREPKVTCMGCQGQSMFNLLASKHTREVMGHADNDTAVGVMLAQSRDFDKLKAYVEDCDHCWLPIQVHGDPHFAIVCVQNGNPLRCGKCGERKSPSNRHHFVVDLDAETTCTDCLGKSIWDMVAEKHRANVLYHIDLGQADAELISCWTRTFGMQVGSI